MGVEARRETQGRRGLRLSCSAGQLLSDRPSLLLLLLLLPSSLPPLLLLLPVSSCHCLSSRSPLSLHACGHVCV